MILRIFMAIVFASTTLAATPALLAIVSSEAAAVKCRMINIGTPEKPRYVKDPACGSGR